MAPKLRDNIEGVTDPAIVRLCHRAGVLRVGASVYPQVRSTLKALLEMILQKAILLMEADRRKTLLERDARKAFELCGIDLAVGVNDDVKRAHEHKSSPKAEGTTHKFKAGTVALRDIRYQQKNSDTYVIPKAVFDRLLHELAQDYINSDKDVRIAEEAKMMIQVGVEHNLVVLLEAAYKVVISKKQNTLEERDIVLAKSILETKYLQRC